MKNIVFDTKKIYEIIYKLAYDANIELPLCVYEKIKNSNIDENLKAEILQNAYLAHKKQRPLCQDCGQVVVFLEIGQNVNILGDYIEDVINKAVEDCYIENCFRKSVVKDAIKDRNNTNTNTPVIIHTKIIKEDKIKILLALKGGGAENTSQVKMFNPTANYEEILDFVHECAKNAVKYTCPPISIGIGIGGTLEYASFLAKKALFEGEIIELCEKNVYETKILTTSTHIANMPVCVNINCHSARFKKCEINFQNNEEIIFEQDNFEPKEILIKDEAKKIKTSDIEEFKKLKVGDRIKLTGTIYTARDMAHKRLVSMIEKNEKLPFELKNSIIFYAGPAPKKDNEIIGPIGPTTSKRMDKFAKILYEKGVLLTIGKGEREKNYGMYLTAVGGVACNFQDCIKSAKIKAFEDLKTEAIYELEVEDMPLTVHYV